MMRRSSRASDHSSFNLKSENDDDLEDFVRFVGSNQDLRIFQTKSSQLLSSGYNLSSGSDTTNSSAAGSMFRSDTKKVALSHFQNLRDTHNSLSESLSSSIMIGNSSQHDPVSGTSPVSSISSTGRSYQPIIPSPLHAEQRSTSPVHIPRSYPQLRSLTNNQNALRIARLPQSSENEQDVFHVSDDMSAYSTYPQDHHHQDLHMLRNAATTSNSNRIIGRAVTIPQQREKSPTNRYEEESSETHLYNLQRSRHTDGGSSLMQDNSTTTDINSSGQGRTNSMMDDDDSLVFKMSELECEGPSGQQKQQNMLFNHRFNTPEDIFNSTSNDHFLELTPTPLSPPLLHRLQAISMSTVTEEEEKGSLSASGSSSKSESSSKVAAKPSQLPFNAW